MKNLWKELVNSLGFALSVIILLLVLPMAFTFVMGIFGNAETLAGAGIGLLILGLLFYYLMTRKPEKQIEEKLWEEKKEALPKKTIRGKIVETSVEEAERLDVRKREHFEKLPFKHGIRMKYFYGLNKVLFQGKSPTGSLTIMETLMEDIEWALKRDKATHRYFQQMHDGENIRKRLYNNWQPMSWDFDGWMPHKLIAHFVNEHIQYHNGKDRQNIEDNLSNEFEKLRWIVTYSSLVGIYGGNRLFKVKLSSDMKEYTVFFPFDVPPLKYVFDCTPDEEMDFIKHAMQRVDDCKVKYHEGVHGKMYSEKQKFLIENKVADYYAKQFHWELDATEQLDKALKNNEERSGMYEREA